MSLAAAVAEEVRRRMTARGWSQNELARRAGMAPTQVHRTMAGQRDLGIDELTRVARALGVTPEYLLRIARTTVPPSGERSESNSAPASS